MSADSSDLMYSEKRHWVRLTRVCNNNCIFCLDKDPQDSSIVPYEKVVCDLKKGLENGATRVILSGGEPTMHPKFIDIVGAAKEAGYKKAQVITNGRRFAYKDFIDETIKAGVDEITFSIHGHKKELHDTLTGVKGSFSQCLKGLLQALHSKKLIVNVDIVLNKLNYKHLPDMIRFFNRLGIYEFDLLQVVPFGSAWKNKDSLFFPLEEIKPYLEDALQFAESRGIRLWTNRFPPEYLEGREGYIQDPVKIMDEVRGRREFFDDYIYNNQSLPCVGERCSFCFLKQFCQELFQLREKLGRGKIDGIHITHESLQKADLIKMLNPQYVVLSSVAPDSFHALKLDGRKCIVKINSEEEWDAWEGNGNSLNFQFLIHSETKDFILAHFKKLSDNQNITFSMPLRDTLEESKKSDINLKAFFNQVQQINILYGNIKNIPPCIYQGQAFVPENFYDLTVFNEDLGINIYEFVKYFIKNRYKVKSIRCKECKFQTSCEGLPIHYVRNFGFSQMRFDAYTPSANASCKTLEKKSALQKNYKIMISSPCDFDCLFCSAKQTDNMMKTMQEDDYFNYLKAEMDNGRKEGCASLFVTGFEILNFTHILNVFRYAKKIGFESFELQTTGMKFHDKKFTKDFMDVLGDRVYIQLPLYGHTALRHDSITGLSGSYSRLMVGIQNLLSYGKPENIKILTVLIKQNYKDAPLICDFVHQLGMDNLPLRLPFPVTDSKNDRYASVAIKLSELLPYVLYCKHPVFLDMMYPCIFLKYWSELSSGQAEKAAKTFPFVLSLLFHKDEQILSSFIAMRQNFVNHNRVCLVSCPYINNCIASPYCAQKIFRKYLLLFGSKEFCCVTEEKVNMLRNMIESLRTVYA